MTEEPRRELPGAGGPPARITSTSGLSGAGWVGGGGIRGRYPTNRTASTSLARGAEECCSRGGQHEVHDPDLRLAAGSRRHGQEADQRHTLVGPRASRRWGVFIEAFNRELDESGELLVTRPGLAVLPVETVQMTLETLRTQKTVILTTYRRDGREVDTPIHIVVQDGRAFIRTYETALKTTRLRRNPKAFVWRATNGTAPALLALLAPKQSRRTGNGVPVHARELTEDEARIAGKALAGKYPILQGLLIPAMHRYVYRTPTVHFELQPEP